MSDVLADRRLIPNPRSGNLITPTGVLVYDGPPHTDAWYDARTGGITATDLVKIMGYSQYGNATSVWGIKTGRLDEDPAGEAAQWGLDHEEKIALRWGERHGTTTSKVGVLAHARFGHHRASLDALVAVCPDGDGPCGAQWKTRSAFKTQEWKHDVPDDVYFQEQWECHVSGYRHMHVGVLLGGNSLQSFRVDRDEDDLAQMIARADEVWAAVEANEPPRDAPSRLLTSVLHRLYPDRAGQAEIPDTTALELVNRWRAAKDAATTANRAAKRAKEAVEDAEAEMIAQLGDRSAAFTTSNPEPVFALVTGERKGFAVEPTITRQLKVNASWQPLERNET